MRHSLALFALASALAGCGTISGVPFSAGTVRPDPYTEVEEDLGTQGGLVVWTATVGRMAANGAIIPTPRGYRIVDSAGKTTEVRNSDPARPSAQPEKVTLAPGRYTIEAPADTLRLATVTVDVLPGVTTVVNLLNADYPDTQPPPSAAVLSPEGYAIGWR